MADEANESSKRKKGVKGDPGIQHDADGRPFFQFTGPGGKRRKLRLTDIPKREAERHVEKINALNRYVRKGIPLDDELAGWVNKITRSGGAFYWKLVDFGLLPKPVDAASLPQAPAVPTLGPFVESYVATRSDVKSGTATFYGHTKRNLVEFFGADCALAAITHGDAKRFRLWLSRPFVEGEANHLLSGQGLSEATARRRCTMASQFFKAAIDDGFITKNPFTKVGGTVRSNKARMFFVTREMADKVLAACPDDELRLFFALSRFGGLRTPSEHNELRLDEIYWDEEKFLVRSPKTEHHEGGDSRFVPIFPELRELLLNAAETAERGQVYVFRKYRNQINLRTRFSKIIKRAGLVPWPKLFQNLRSTRQTELAATEPIDVVCRWLGNKAAIAMEHYLQPRADEFKRAANGVTSGATEANAAAKVVADMGQSRITSDYQSVPSGADDCNIRRVSDENDDSRWAMRDSNDSHSVRENVAKTQYDAPSGAIVVAVRDSADDHHHPASDGRDEADFAALIAAWSSVPLEAGRAILPHLTMQAVMAIAKAFGSRVDEAFAAREIGDL